MGDGGGTSPPNGSTYLPAQRRTLRSGAAKEGIASLDESHKPVSEVARDAGVGDHFALSYRMLSKFAPKTHDSATRSHTAVLAPNCVSLSRLRARHRLHSTTKRKPFSAQFFANGGANRIYINYCNNVVMLIINCYLDEVVRNGGRNVRKSRCAFYCQEYRANSSGRGHVVLASGSQQRSPVRFRRLHPQREC